MGETYLVRFDEGEDILEALEEFSKERDIEYANPIRVSGYITNISIVTTGMNAGMDKHNYKGPFRVNAISGKIQKAKQGGYRIDLNVAVSGIGVGSITGTLMQARAGEALEISVKKIDLSKMIES